MTTIPEPVELNTSPDISPALALFTRQFATLLTTGLSLMKILQILQEEAPPPFGEASKEIYDRVAEGHVLSRALGKRPELFSPLYVRLFRLGEASGMLDITLDYMAELLEEAWEFSSLLNEGERASLLSLCRDPRPEEGEGLSENGRKLVLLLFCRLLSQLLSVGAPVGLSLEAASHLFPEAERDLLKEAAHQDRTESLAEALSKTEVLPILILELWTVGENYLPLHETMEKAAQLYRCELLYQLGLPAGRGEWSRRPVDLTADQADSTVDLLKQSWEFSRLERAVPAKTWEEEIEFLHQELEGADGGKVRGVEDFSWWGERTGHLVGAILVLAFRREATEIRLETVEVESGMEARFTLRKGEELLAQRLLPQSVYQALLFRFKVLGRLEPLSQDWRQDGAYRTYSEGKEYSLHVSYIPGQSGGTMVLQILS